MNGRIYDPELGRMLSPDPFVQVPEYSQNFNRYSYVLNNPLNTTDPSGYSWLSQAFDGAGDWFKENWRTVASIVVGALLIWSGIGASLFWGLHGLTGAGIVGTHAAVVYGGIGAITGSIMGGIYSALNGGNLGDIARSALVGGIEGGLSGGLHMVGGSAQMGALNIVGHGVVGGAANEAMGGKFQDGFLSAAASAATAVSGWTDPEANVGKSIGVDGRTAIASIAGGTASALGGGKFANGAWTGAFHHLLNAEAETLKDLVWKPEHRVGDKWYLWLYEDKYGPIEKVANGERQYGPGSLKGQCAAGAQVLCGHGNSDVPMVRYWRAGLTIFEMWERNIGVLVGVVMAKFNQRGEYDNAPGGAGLGNHTILYLGHNKDGTFRIADQFHYKDSSGVLHTQNYTIRPVSGEDMARFIETRIIK